VVWAIIKMIPDSKVSREIKELTLLFEISTKLSEALDFKAVLQPILRMTTEHMGILRSSLTILNRQKEEIAIEEAYGLRPEEQAKGKYRLGEGITGKVFETGHPAIIPRISEEPLFLDRTGSRKKLNKNDLSFVCVPIKIGSEVIGTLSADRFFQKGAVLEEDIRLLTIIASIISQAVRLRQQAQEEVEKIREENQRLQDELKTRYKPKAIVGNSKSMQNVYALIEKVCRTNATVLILGESGVGKERVAHAIHYNSDRAEKPFIKVNCAVLPESLVESELFGHEKGAFTGAVGARQGRFEMAHGGTIFLDEIGDLPLVVQTKLLRILQEKEFERVGGNHTLKTDVRVITATNRNLEGLIEEGKFREDLYYRLNTFPVVVPPLRQRQTDIMLLTDHFVEKYSREYGKHITRISTTATEMLTSYHWPGNVRELENCLERAIILSSDGVIHGYLLPPNLQKSDSVPLEKTGSYQSRITGLEKEMIIEELKRCKGQMAKAARTLGITERMMGLRVARYGIDLGQIKRIARYPQI